MISELVQACQWDTNNWFLFSGNVFSPLIYYSHLTPIFVSLIFGLYIYLTNRKSRLNKTLFVITGILSLWLLLDLILWATDNIQTVLFAWSLVNMIEPLIYAGFVYFIYLFVVRDDVSHNVKLLLVLPLLPSIFMAPLHWNVVGFNLTNCDREVIEGPIAFYNYAIEIGYVLWIMGIAWWSRRLTQDRDERRQIMLAVGTVLILLLGFASGNIIGSFSENWALGQFGLFVIPVSVAALSYFIVRFRLITKSQITAAQLLVIGLWLSVGSILFLQNIKYVHYIIIATLIFLTVLGYLLLQSFRIEVEQRRRIEELARTLEVANRQQVTLIHFVTHQIKGFVAKSRNIFSMALEGDFGPIPDTLRPMLEEGFKSDTKGAQTIQEILNAANIKSGKVTYVKTPIAVTELVQEALTDLRPGAEGKGLTVTVTTPETPLTIMGDRMQLLNAIKNLIDNSIKYTPKGSVAVKLGQENQTCRLTVTDTGIGITTEDMENLFTEGGHGKESQKINVDSTGFGLYIVKNIIEAHSGKVWAESEGSGKGTTFIVELPIS